MKIHNIGILVKSEVADCGLRQILRNAEGLRVIPRLDSTDGSRRHELSAVIADPYSLDACPEGVKRIGFVATHLPAETGAMFTEILTLYDTAEDVVRKVRGVIGEGVSEQGDKRASDLSPREKDVVRLIVKGLSNKEIATEMDVSVNTVMTHRRNIASKLKIHSSAGLTIFALATGLVKMEDLTPNDN